MTTSKYRFITGSLYILDGNSYRHCFTQFGIRTKAEAIAAYEGRDACRLDSGPSTLDKAACICDACIRRRINNSIHNERNGAS